MLLLCCFCVRACVGRSVLRVGCADGLLASSPWGPQHTTSIRQRHVSSPCAICWFCKLFLSNRKQSQALETIIQETFWEIIVAGRVSRAASNLRFCVEVSRFRPILRHCREGAGNGRAAQNPRTPGAALSVPLLFRLPRVCVFLWFCLDESCTRACCTRSSSSYDFSTMNATRVMEKSCTLFINFAVRARSEQPANLQVALQLARGTHI